MIIIINVLKKIAQLTKKTTKILDFSVRMLYLCSAFMRQS